MPNLGAAWTHLDHLHRLLLQALRPRQLRTLLRLARAEQNLESLLDIVREILGRV
jgi:hypothetical protein